MMYGLTLTIAAGSLAHDVERHSVDMVGASLKTPHKLRIATIPQYQCTKRIIPWKEVCMSSQNTLDVVVNTRA